MPLPQYKRILVIAAHPDDEVLGCGGTLARFADEGAEIHVAILANGITSRIGVPANEAADLLKVHHERARKAGALLGAKDVRVLGFGDQKLDAIPLLDVTHAIETEVARIGPDAIFTQHGGDLNMDHVVAFRATLTATRPMRGRALQAVFAYPVASSTEWAFGRFEPRFTPDVFSDISSTLERKIEAMEIYESEARAFPHPRSPEALRAAAAHWGSAVGVMAAEPFETIWQAW